MIIEFVYITVHYACGCSYARPERPPRESREVFSHLRCKSCAQLESQTEARRTERTGTHYIVDGRKMNVHQSSGYWVGRCYENGKVIRKYFGKSDPRPSLEVVL